MPLRARAFALMLLLLLQSLACLVGVRFDPQRNLLAHALVHGQGLDHHHHQDFADGSRYQAHGFAISLHPDAIDTGVGALDPVLYEVADTVEDRPSVKGHQHFHDVLQVLALPLAPQVELALRTAHAPPSLLALAPPLITLEGPMRPPRAFSV